MYYNEWENIIRDRLRNYNIWTARVNTLEGRSVKSPASFGWKRHPRLPGLAMTASAAGGTSLHRKKWPTSRKKSWKAG